MSLAPCHPQPPPAQGQGRAWTEGLSQGRGHRGKGGGGQEGASLSSSADTRTYRSRNNCQHPEAPLPDCTAEAGHSRCAIPRRHLQLYQNMSLWVQAENALGTSKSVPLCLMPSDVGE